MDHLFDFGRIFLGLVFAFSVAGKVHRPAAFRAFRQSVVSLAPPLRGAATPAAALIVVAETASALTLALPVTAPVGFTLSVVLVTAFTAALVVALRTKTATTCGCFGDSGSPVAPRHIARNVVLLLAAGGGLFGWAAGAAGAGRPTGSLVLVSGLAAILAIVTATLDDIVSLFNTVPETATHPRADAQQ
ncbi:MauE/DoxX family redox-associated membrane protein [Micromonospora costi]|uniref:MauE/DoxX family redox-associated membrane protein n=1 Tax=Micromonospora costi TaxID=1530042 RepID=UPI001319E861|nr:MauE/DoxX family redox-associated membrane protein [Micromonospora costi]